MEWRKGIINKHRIYSMFSAARPYQKMISENKTIAVEKKYIGENKQQRFAAECRHRAGATDTFLSSDKCRNVRDNHEVAGTDRQQDHCTSKTP